VEVAPLPSVAGGEVSAFHFKAPYELKRPARILLVDAYYETRVALGKMLSLCGQVVTIAQDAKEALDLATRYPLDLLINEVNLPGMSGIDLMLELQKVQPIPDIATCVFNARDQEESALAAGFDRLLIKPIPITQLIHSIDDVIKKAQFLKKLIQKT